MSNARRSYTSQAHSFESKPMTAPYSPLALFALSREMYPHGFHSGRFLRSNIDGNDLMLRIVTHRAGDKSVEFLLFPRGAHYARYCIIVYNTGKVVVSNEGTIPDWDKPAVEPVFTSTADEMLQSFFALLNKQFALRKRKQAS